MSCQCVCVGPQDEYFAANIPLCRIFHSHTAKNIPCTVWPPHSVMLCSYLTSLHHHHLRAHGKDFMLLLLKTQLSSLATSVINVVTVQS